MKNEIIKLTAIFTIVTLGFILISWQIGKDDTYADFKNPKSLQKIKGGIGIAEGFIYHPKGYFLFTEVNGSKIWKLNPKNISIALYKSVEGKPARLELYKDQIYFTDHQHRDIRKITTGGSVEIVVSNFNGKKFNSPMSPTFTAAGMYFTDPNFLKSGEKQLDFNGLFLFSNNEVSIVDKSFKDPNGTLLSKNGRLFYVLDYGTNEVFRYDVDTSGKLQNKKKIISLKSDGISGYGLDGGTLDRQGNLWLTGGPGILVYSKEGKLLHQMKAPEFMTNLSWDDRFQKLYATGYTSIYEVKF